MFDSHIVTINRCESRCVSGVLVPRHPYANDNDHHRSSREHCAKVHAVPELFIDDATHRQARNQQNAQTHEKLEYMGKDILQHDVYELSCGLFKCITVWVWQPDTSGKEHHQFPDQFVHGQ